MVDHVLSYLDLYVCYLFPVQIKLHILCDTSRVFSQKRAKQLANIYAKFYFHQLSCTNATHVLGGHPYHLGDRYELCWTAHVQRERNFSPSLVIGFSILFLL